MATDAVAWHLGRHRRIPKPAPRFVNSCLTCCGAEREYAPLMPDELAIDMRRTQLMALDANLSDVHTALVRAARIRSGFSAEVRALLAKVDDLEGRVMAEVIRRDPPPTAPLRSSSVDLGAEPESDLIG